MTLFVIDCELDKQLCDDNKTITTKAKITKSFKNNRNTKEYKTN